MARRRVQSTPEARRIKLPYTIIGFIFIAFMVASTIGHVYVYERSRTVYSEIISVERNIKEMTNELNNIDMEMLSIAAGIAEDPIKSDETIMASFAEIKRISTAYEAQNLESKKMAHRFRIAEYAIKAYERKINELINNPNSSDSAQLSLSTGSCTLASNSY